MTPMTNTPQEGKKETFDRAVARLASGKSKPSTPIFTVFAAMDWDANTEPMRIRAPRLRLIAVAHAPLDECKGLLPTGVKAWKPK